MASGQARAVDVAALTVEGVALAGKIARGLPRPARVLLPQRLSGQPHEDIPAGFAQFDRFADAAREAFLGGRDLVCVMACGIVVRGIAPLLRGKDRDPAVVVVDEAGRFAISLLSGHMGGANSLAREVASIIGGSAVITTATDTRGLPAFDVIASETGCAIEDIRAVRTIHSALLEGRTVRVVDPEGIVAPFLSRHGDLFIFSDRIPRDCPPDLPCVYVGASPLDLPRGWLVLRPRILAVGVGCNRGAGAGEIEGLVRQTLREGDISPLSVAVIASVEDKRDEPGMREAARRLGVDVRWFSKKDLEGIQVPNPSDVVRRHMGIGSVSEAAALAASGAGSLLVTKRKSTNATVAVARFACSPS